jgi:hypothetical protein
MQLKIFRTLIGATNPVCRGTLRIKAYATSQWRKMQFMDLIAMKENAAIEGAFHFAGRERLQISYIFPEF